MGKSALNFKTWFMSHYEKKHTYTNRYVCLQNKMNNNCFLLLHCSLIFRGPGRKRGRGEGRKRVKRKRWIEREGGREKEREREREREREEKNYVLHKDY